MPRNISLRLFWIAILAGCILSAPGVSRGQDADAMTLLKKAAATYRNLGSYEAYVTVSTTDGVQTSERNFIETGSGASYRLEDGNAAGRLRVDDGRTQWVLDRKTNQYAKTASSAGAPAYIAELAQLDQNIKEAEVLREDIFTVDGKTKKYYIVMVDRTRWPAGTPAGAQDATIRIDEDTFEVAGGNIYTDGPTEMRRYSLTKRNEKVAADTFKFVPPASAKEVVSLRPEHIVTASIIGSEAPDFTLSDAAGHPYHLRDLRGKVVIVDFWASWCPPCRESMPDLQKISDQFASRGVIVLGLDGGEDAQTVTDFAVSEHYTFPLLLGGEPIVTERYFLTAYPTTVVVDRSGHIVYWQDGYDGPKALLAAVDAAASKSN